jgi:hypothetical protein
MIISFETSILLNLYLNMGKDLLLNHYHFSLANYEISAL